MSIRQKSKKGVTFSVTCTDLFFRYVTIPRSTFPRSASY